MQHTIIRGPARETFPVDAPLYCPYDSTAKKPSDSFGLHYYHQEAFVHNPFTILAQAASGSPVISDWAGRFFGFLKYAAIEQSTFAFDGKNRLSVEIPEGQELYVSADGDRDAHWKRYNEIVMADIVYERIRDFPAFWSSVEYCTWVEQKYLAGNKSAHDPLDDAMVASFTASVDGFGWPKGRITIDHGWSEDCVRTGFGDWKVDTGKFPDFARTADLIARSGHVPGLWLGLAKIHPQSALAAKYPEFLGEPQTKPWQEADGGQKPGRNDVMHFLNPDADLHGFFCGVFRSFRSMGFRKFKIDMSYHRKHRMIRLHEKMYRAAKEVDRSIELEFHLPDIFGARWCDTVRTNDVWCVPFKPWYELTAERYKVCYRSAPGRLINRDHMGGNHIGVTEDDFLAHFETYRKGVGYPLVSLLPHHISDRAIRMFGEFLWEYDRKRNVVSNF